MSVLYRVHQKPVHVARVRFSFLFPALRIVVVARFSQLRLVVHHSPRRGVQLRGILPLLRWFSRCVRGSVNIRYLSAQGVYFLQPGLKRRGRLAERPVDPIRLVGMEEFVGVVRNPMSVRSTRLEGPFVLVCAEVVLPLVGADSFWFSKGQLILEDRVGLALRSEHNNF